MWRNEWDSNYLIFKFESKWKHWIQVDHNKMVILCYTGPNRLSPINSIAIELKTLERRAPRTGELSMSFVSLNRTLIISRWSFKCKPEVCPSLARPVRLLSFPCPAYSTVLLGRCEHSPAARSIERDCREKFFSKLKNQCRGGSIRWLGAQENFN